MSLELFIGAYLEAVDFTKADVGDDEAYDACEGLSDAFNERARTDCTAFYEAHGEQFSDDAQAGHDFWLTRQGHGAGFWDRAPEVYGEHATALTDAAHAAGTVEAYVGDDGFIHA
jgi:hypothetical protein